MWSLHPSIQPCDSTPVQREVENTVSSPRNPEPPSPSRPILAAKVNSGWDCLLTKRIAHFCKEERVLGLTAGTLPPTRHKHPQVSLFTVVAGNPLTWRTMRNGWSLHP